MMERSRIEFHAIGRKRMKEARSAPMPIHELYAELEGGLCLAQELDLVDTQAPIEIANGRQRGFAHSDGSYLAGLDHGDAPAQASGEVRECRRSHPASCAATDDDDLLDLRAHELPAHVSASGSTAQKRRMNSACVGVSRAAVAMRVRMCASVPRSSPSSKCSASR